MPILISAQPYNEGSKKCKECHELEYDVWKKTKHFKAYKDVHKRKEAQNILDVVGGGKTMKRNKNCSTCHYTKITKSLDKPAKSKSGPSCESCHGASSDYREMHNDYGGKNVKAPDETPEHKKDRIAKSKDAGLIWSFMHFDIAMNCMSCHGLARPDIDGETFAKMMTTKHPANDKFELVKYSQGTVRHRFFPPDQKVNAEMTTAELSRLFVVGQAAILVSATAAEASVTDEAYKTFQKKRADKARKILSTLNNIPEVTALLDAPNEDTGRKLADAIKDLDLSADVADMLPVKTK